MDKSWAILSIAALLFVACGDLRRAETAPTEAEATTTTGAYRHRQLTCPVDLFEQSTADFPSDQPGADTPQLALDEWMSTRDFRLMRDFWAPLTPEDLGFAGPGASYAFRNSDGQARFVVHIVEKPAGGFAVGGIDACAPAGEYPELDG